MSHDPWFPNGQDAGDSAVEHTQSDMAGTDSSNRDYQQPKAEVPDAHVSEADTQEEEDTRSGFAHMLGFKPKAKKTVAARGERTAPVEALNDAVEPHAWQDAPSAEKAPAVHRSPELAVSPDQTKHADKNGTGTAQKSQTRIDPHFTVDASGQPDTVENTEPGPKAEPPVLKNNIASAVDTALRQSAAQANGTLEDNLRAMLRPIIKEWLDENMPRILENAIREELAASAKKPPADQA